MKVKTSILLSEATSQQLNHMSHKSTKEYSSNFKHVHIFKN